MTRDDTGPAVRSRLVGLVARSSYYRTRLALLAGAGLLAFASSVGTEIALATGDIARGSHAHFAGAFALPFLCLVTMVLVTSHAFLCGIPRAIERVRQGLSPNAPAETRP